MPGASSEQELAGRWSTWTQRVVALILLAMLLTVIVLTGPFLPAIMLASLLVTILYLPIRIVVARKWLGYKMAVVAAFALYVLILGVLFYLLAVPIADTASYLLENLRAFLLVAIAFLEQYTPNQGWLTDVAGNRLVNLNFVLEPLSRLVKGIDAFPFLETAQPLFGFFLGAVGSLGNAIVNFLFIHLLAVYALFELPTGFHWIAHTLPPGPRREYSLLLQRSAGVLAGYGRGLVINTLISGSLAAVLLLLFGVAGAFGVALFATFFLLIPIIGGWIAGALIFLAALSTPDNILNLQPLMFAIVVYLAYTALQGGFIATLVEPRIYGRVVALPVTLIIVGLAILGYYAGFFGMVLAVPILGIVREIVTFLARKLRRLDPYPHETEPSFVSQSVLLDVMGPRDRRRA